MFKQKCHVLSLSWLQVDWENFGFSFVLNAFAPINPKFHFSCCLVKFFPASFNQHLATVLILSPREISFRTSITVWNNCFPTALALDWNKGTAAWKCERKCPSKFTLSKKQIHDNSSTHYLSDVYTNIPQKIGCSID